MLDEIELDIIEELKDPEFAKGYGIECARSELGLALLHARQNSKLTQKELAAQLGVSQPYIAQIESGEVTMTSDVIGKMLAVLGLKISVILEPLVPQDKPIITNYTLLRQGFWCAGFDINLLSAVATGVTVQDERVFNPNTPEDKPCYAVTITSPSNENAVSEPRLIPNPSKVVLNEEPVLEAA